MRLVKKAPNITDLFTTLDAPPSPAKTAVKGAPNRIVRPDFNDSDTEGDPLPHLATPRRLAMVEDMDKRKRTSSLPLHDQIENGRDSRRPKGQVSRLMVTEKRKRSVSATAVPEQTTAAVSPDVRAGCRGRFTSRSRWLRACGWLGGQRCRRAGGIAPWTTRRL